MSKINWTAVAVFGIVVLLALVIGISLLGGGRAYGGWGMVGPGMMGSWSFGPLGWLGGIFMWLIPIGLIVLVVLGIAWLVRSLGGGVVKPPAATRACPNCGRSVQADWRNCPYCGTALTST